MSVRWPAKTTRSARPSRLGLPAQGRGQVAVADHQQPGRRVGGEEARRGLEQGAVVLLGAEPSHDAHHQRVLRQAQLAPRLPRDRRRDRRELVERRAVPDEPHALGRHEALAHQEVARGRADRDGPVGEARQQPVGQRLVGRQARVGEVFVQDQGGPHAPRGQPPEVGGGVSVHVQDAGAPPASRADDVSQQPWIEAPAAEVLHGDALLGQELRGRLGSLQAEQAHLEARRVVAREPPGEQAGDAVDAGALDAELVADMEDADRRHS